MPKPTVCILDSDVRYSIITHYGITDGDDSLAMHLPLSQPIAPQLLFWSSLN